VYQHHKELRELPPHVQVCAAAHGRFARGIEHHLEPAAVQELLLLHLPVMLVLHSTHRGSVCCCVWCGRFSSAWLALSWWRSWCCGRR
jgi:hypothetical protein